MQEYTTMEYILPEAGAKQAGSNRPIFMLVVDTSVPAEELVELKDSL